MSCKANFWMYNEEKKNYALAWVQFNEQLNQDWTY